MKPTIEELKAAVDEQVEYIESDCVPCDSLPLELRVLVDRAKRLGAAQYEAFVFGSERNPTHKQKTLAIAEGLKLLSRHTIVLKAEGGSVLVGIGRYFELDEADASVLVGLGWFIDSFTGYWCFCV